MAKIKIAELDINTDAVLKATSELKKEIDSLKKQQKDLQKNGESSSKQFVKNAADLKKLNQTYKDNTTALAANTKVVQDATVQQQLLDQAINTEITSIKEAREQNKLLNRLRNETNTTTKEGQAQIKLLNSRLDENNEFIKENADAYTQQKINIGNYSDSVKEALNDVNLFNGGLGGFVSRAQEAGGVGPLLTSSLGAATQGMFGLVRASLAFIVTPIGAVIAALVAAFALVKNALNRSEEATGKLSRAFSGITGIFDGVLKALEPIGEFLIDVLINNIELAESAFFAAAEGIASALEFLGFEDAAKSVSSFTDGLKEASENAKLLEDAENRLKKAQRETEKQVKKLQKEQEDLRQIRDDETKSFRERIDANDRLALKLKEQQKLEEETALIAVEAAKRKIAADGATEDAKDKLAEAELNLFDIRERINGIESEQLTNRVQLQREAADKAIEIQKAQLDLFIENQGIRAKTLQEEANIAQQVANKKLEILKAELNNRKITQAQFDAEQAKIQNELLQAQTDAVVNAADRELQAFVDANQKKLDANKFFNDELLQQEQNRINSVQQAQLENAQFRLEQGTINEEEYQDAITQIQKDSQALRDEANLQREEAEKQKQAIDLENRRIAEDITFQDDFAIKQERLEFERQQEVENAEATGADIGLINQKFALQQEDLDNQAKIAKISNQQAAIGEIGALLSAFGKESQGIQVALTAADGFLATQKAYTSQLVPGDPTSIARAVGAAIKTGLFAAANVAKVSGVKFEKGGLQEIGGKRHISGGTKFVGEDGTAFEAEQGELIGVMNRNAAQHFMAFNNSFPSGKSTPSFFQGGGIISQGVRSQSLDTNELAEITTEAVANLPAPIVTVEDINIGQTRTVEVESGADL